MSSSPRTLVLASTSPFRKALLERLSIPFLTAAPGVDESALPGETPESLVKRLAEKKARVVAAQFPDALIIGSDQVSIVNDSVVGKPGTHEAAVKQLRNASGQCVRFLTGLCLLDSATNGAQIDVVPFEVTFRTLTDNQIEQYLQRDKPYNCAGSFRSEKLGIALFEKMAGDDPNSLIGLPLIRLVTMLEKAGYPVI